ncbi:MAG: SpoVA/SpoVAEb family sporulation membrane protein [Oscillospiraceae bacterium]|nr:SpoVA/SpoVAEb family sporulation membrane protein [Oscillospiraceae bacterium]
MKMTNEQYEAYVKTVSPASPLGKNLIFAFLTGGAVCTVGEALRQGFLSLGCTLREAGAFTAVSLVFLSALLTAFHLYDDIARVGGAGTLVPITGFANAMVSPAIEYKSEGWVMGLAVKMFSIAGPVLVYGSAAATLYGLILWAWEKWA